MDTSGNNPWFGAIIALRLYQKPCNFNPSLSIYFGYGLMD